MAHLEWTRGLDSAPRVLPEHQVLVAIIDGVYYPEAVHWVEYEPDLVEEIGEDGYWDYREQLVSEVSGGVPPKHLKTALWAIIDLPCESLDRQSE